VHEAVHSPPYSAKVKNDGAVPPLPIHLHGMVHVELVQSNFFPDEWHFQRTGVTSP
jgi:hypothetical protein